MTDISPFASVGQTLVRLGYSAIPISPIDKFPARFSGGQWWPMKDWARYCAELPGAFMLSAWGKWPATNVGVALGRGVIAFDIDLDDLIAPIKAVLPTCVVAKRGRKGETLFFRGNTTVIRSGGFRRPAPTEDKPNATEGLMDLIADGKQTVIPPSIHPITGEPYFWTTERTLLDTPPADLTEVTEAHVAAVIEVLRAHGYQAAEDKRPIGSGSAGIVIDTVSSTADWFRRLNEDALANLSAWVPRLGLSRLTSSGDGYRSVAEWRPSNSGNPINKRPLLLSIDPKGIVDYGEGEKGYTPINLVMAALDVADWELEKAAVWLGEALGYDFSPKIVLNKNRPKLSPIQQAQKAARAAQEAEEPPAAPAVAPEVVAAVLAHPGEVEALAESVAMVPAEPTNVIAFVDPDEAAPALSYEDELSSLVEGVPGLVGKLVDWINATNSTPNPILAFSAALAFVGALAGRNYESPTDARTNVYTVGLAPSGFGKDHARKVVNHIVDKGNLGRWLGGSKIMSGSAMRKRIEQNPATLYMIDEFAGFMSEINNKKMPHSYQIRDHLLEYFGTASGTFRGADYAGEQATPVKCPNVCLYGTSTQVDFWGSCRSISVADGFLARCLIFPVGGNLPIEVEPKFSAKDPPAAIVKACQHLTLSKAGGNLNNVMSDGTTACVALVASWHDVAAKDTFYAMKAEFRRIGFEKGEEEGALWNRTAEHALKVALILSVGVDPLRPTIRKEILGLARRIVELCTLMTLDQITGRLADNDRQREHIDVKRWIVEAGEGGISRTTISKRVNGRFDKRRLADILDSLRDESKEVVAVESKPAGGGRPGTRYYSTAIMAAMADAG